MSKRSSGQDRKQELVSLVLQHQSEISRYVFSMVPNRNDAEDLFQNAIAVICEKFDEFDAETNLFGVGFQDCVLGSPLGQAETCPFEATL